MSDITKILSDSYGFFKQHFISSNGRPLCDTDETDLDKDGNLTENVTLSQGVSATLLRAAAMKDRETFDRTWKWAKANMQRLNIGQTYNPGTGVWSPIPSAKKDHLFASRYIPGLRGKEGGILNNSDFDSSADTDQDIAAALLIADRKWGSTSTVNYRQEAQLILNDIWDKETIIVAGKRVLIGGDAQRSTRDPLTGRPTVGINPSYLRPTYYEFLFASADRSHDWRSLVATSYEVIAKSSDATLHNQSGSPVDGKINLPPNWVSLDSGFNVRDHGFLAGDHIRDDYYAGGDSFRLLFWMSLQTQLNPTDQFAKHFLLDQSGTSADIGPRAFLTKEMANNQTIFSDYLIDGRVFRHTETLRSLSMDMIFFHAAGDTKNAQRILNKIMAAYDQNSGYWKTNNPQDYYAAQNWVWFGLFVLANGPDKLLGGSLTPSAITPYRVAQSAHPFQVDRGIGFQTEDNTPILDKEQLENLSLQQLEETAKAIAAQPFLIGGTGPNNVDQFPALAKLDKKYTHKLTPFLINPGAYWNNVTQLASVYAQKCIELDRQDKIVIALKYIDALKKAIDKQTSAGKAFIPAEYFLASLNLADTMLKIQIKKGLLRKELGGNGTQTTTAMRQYYLDARRQAQASINSLLHPVDQRFSSPDYFSLSKALMAIADLDMKIKETDREEIAYLRRTGGAGAAARITELEKECNQLVDEAYDYYGLVAEIDKGIDRQIYAIKVKFGRPEIEASVKKNVAMGNIDKNEADEAINIIYKYQKAVAAQKRASLLPQLHRVKTEAEIIGEIDRCDRATAELDSLRADLKAKLDRDPEPGKAATIQRRLRKMEDGYFVYFGRLVRADLCLALLDRLNFIVLNRTAEDWRAFVKAAREAIPRLSSEPAIVGEAQRIVLAMEKYLGNSKVYSEGLEKLRNDLTRLVVEKVSRPQYQAVAQALTPATAGAVPRYKSLYAWSKVKLIESSVRSADYVKYEGEKKQSGIADYYIAECRRLKPRGAEDTYFEPGEYLAIELDYLESIFHAYRFNNKDKRTLSERIITITLSNGIQRDTAFLPQEQAKYFYLYAEIKRGIARLQYEDAPGAAAIFERVESEVAKLPDNYFPLLAWDIHTLKAELFHQMAVIERDKEPSAANRTGIYTIRAYAECKKSTSIYDKVFRPFFIKKDLGLDEDGYRIQTVEQKDGSERIYFKREK